MWELLYETFWDRLEHFCFNLCRDEARAEDLTQEVFLRALQNRIPRWTQWKPPVYWLCSPRKNGGCSPCAIQRATMPARSVSCSVSRPARSAAALPRYAIASKLNLRRIK